MKKVITLALTLVLAFSLLAACGDGSSTTPSSNSGNSSTSTPPASQSGNDTTPSNNGGNATGDLTTVAGFLAAFGLTENDLKCANFTRLDRTAYIIDEGPDYGKIKEVGAYISQKLTDEEVSAWLEQVINKLNSLSDDGKIANSHADAQGEALTVDFIMNQQMYGGGGQYTYKGKTVGVTIFVVPGYLDNEDPDEAMAACTLRLEEY
ncbi:hypothetical protein FACS1894171_0510 [Clostridia bacterium]|nr:hypothetical protein FACS1894171_0510 [Clostridia bacterium]